MGLLGQKEKIAQKHHLSTIKSENADDSRLKDMILGQWGTEDKETLDLLNNGYQDFKRKSAEKILREQRDKVFINNCPNCNRLARTPTAKQCRYCGHDWH